MRNLGSMLLRSLVVSLTPWTHRSSKSLLLRLPWSSKKPFAISKTIPWWSTPPGVKRNPSRLPRLLRISCSLNSNYYLRHVRTVGEWVLAVWRTSKMSRHRSRFRRPDYDGLPSLWKRPQILKENLDDANVIWCLRKLEISAWDQILCVITLEVVQPPRMVWHQQNRRDCALNLSPWGASACE